MVRNKKGQFEGESGNPSGRPPGALTKVNATVKEQLSDFYMNKMLPALEEDWQKLTPYQRTKCTSDFSNFFIEKLKAVDVRIDFDKLSNEDIELIASEILKGNKANTP